ncbi:MAG: vanadium-dependent haloperoxidase, partial [Cytophagaceae bacterium]|nr:vanadium-dependent haloperoxidase [Gemmatimonadaceae bacterium]
MRRHSSCSPSRRSAARQWNEAHLDAIRHDLARPVVTARHLYHVSAAMWDAWATYDFTARPIFLQENHATDSPNVDAWRSESISFAAYRLLKHRYASSPGAAVVLPKFDLLMASLGYDKDDVGLNGNSPAAIGNRIAATIIAFGFTDGSNEAGNYANQFYVAKNAPLIPGVHGNPTLLFPNNWQPLAIEFFIDQNGNPVPGGSAKFMGAEWGAVKPFSLSTDDLQIHFKDGYDHYVYHDPGPPPQLGTPSAADYVNTFTMVVTWGSHLDPSDGVMMDASPNSLGNSTLPGGIAEYNDFYDFLEGGDNGTGYALNPVTGQPYAPQIVPRGDYSRCLAEFWADGPSSETPPGHWFTILNHVSDSPFLEKRIGGKGPIVNDLEWDVKGYIAMGGNMHDTAVTCWSIKGLYDHVRPISAIRAMADRGQSSDPLLPNYHPEGLPLIPGFIEMVTDENTGPNAKMEHLAGSVGEVAVRSWRGPDFIADPATDVAGVGWLLGDYWWPYQRPSFVTPPFGGYTSGHATYSRAGATIMDKLTGSKYFPGGLGEFICPQNQYLVFEEGPSVDVKLQFVSYYDASDQSSLSRIWGGIHPPVDDIPGRKNGILVANDAYKKAEALFSPWTDLGSSLPGTLGAPVLEGIGKLDAGSSGFLALSNAQPFASAVLIVSLSSTPAPFKGGVLVANPAAFTVSGATQGDGSLTLA